MQSSHSFWLRWRWSLFVTAVVFFVLSTGILHPLLWKILGVGSMAPAFADMEALLAAGEAFKAGHDPFLSPNLFDSYARPHIYGPAWLVTGLFGFTVAHITELSVLTFLGFLGGLFYWYRPQDWRTAAGVLAALLSPPILLGLERANNDLIIVLLISVTAAFSRRKGSLAVAGVILLLATSAWLKLYPLVAGVALLTLPGDFRSAAKRLIFWGLLTAAGFCLYAYDYLRLIRHIPSAQTIFSFDLRYAFTVCAGGIPGLRLWTWTGTLLAGLLAFRMLWLHRRDYWHALPLTGPWAFLTVSASAIWVGCLLANPSYPYRAVWLLPLLAWAANPQQPSPAAGRALRNWFLLSLWLWWIQWQCHFTLIEERHFEYLPVWAAALGLNQAGVILTTGLVAWLFTGWTWRRLCAFFFSPPEARTHPSPETHPISSASNS